METSDKERATRGPPNPRLHGGETMSGKVSEFLYRVFVRFLYRQYSLTLNILCLVELSGIEPLTSTLPVLRSPS